MELDLVCLVADKDMEAGLEEVLRRPKALSVRPIRFEMIRHPGRDPGCFHRAADLLMGYQRRSRHAVVVLDQAWEGAPGNGAELEQALEGKLAASGLAKWARAVVIEPELESWVFAASPRVDDAVGWSGRQPSLRASLESCGLWCAGAEKPEDPKSALDWALRRVNRPRSSVVHREIAQKVSLERCSDRAFLRFRDLLQEWFAETR